METTIITILQTSLFGNLHVSEFLFEILLKYFHIQYGIVLHNFPTIEFKGGMEKI